MAAFSADVELAKTLESLERAERDNSNLKTKLSSFGQRVKLLQKRVSKLEETNKEVSYLFFWWVGFLLS